eukprot:5635212-Pleurochrysis_carterae.AAC.1
MVVLKSCRRRKQQFRCAKSYPRCQTTAPEYVAQGWLVIGGLCQGITVGRHAALSTTTVRRALAHRPVESSSPHRPSDPTSR